VSLPGLLAVSRYNLKRAYVNCCFTRWSNETENINRLTKIEYSILFLQTLKTNYSSVALIVKHYEIQPVQREPEETAAFISEIEAHESTL
jgi:hypothetical protein